MMTSKLKRRGVCAAMMAAGMLWLGGGQAEAAAEPEIVGNSAVIYLDGKDEISVFGDHVKSVSYTSSDGTVATVNETGTVVPHKEGTAKIQAKVTYDDGGKTRTKDLSYDLQVMDSSTNYFVFQKDKIMGLTAKGKQMKEVYIPEYYNNVKVTGLWKNLFKNDTTLEKVVLSDNLKATYCDEVGERQNQIFIGCSRLREIHIGRDMQNFPYLKGNQMLQKFTVNPQNKIYRVRDSVLFREDPNDKNKEWLICYPTAKNDVSYTVPDNVTEIFYYAFYGAKKIKKVVLPNSVSEIKAWAFMKSGVEEVNLPEGLEWIGGQSFRETDLKEVVIPRKTSIQADGAFGECSKLQKVTLPDLVYKECGAFIGCTALKTVVVRNTTVEVYADSFDGCTGLENFQMMPGTSEFYVKDGVLFYGQGVLAVYPQGKKGASYTVPSDVKRIQNRAFAGVKNLKAITLDTALTHIEYEVFLDCSSLVRIRIPKNVTKINEEWEENQFIGPCNLFQGCSSLKEITVDSGNKNFSSVKGVLYNKSKKILYCYPVNKGDKKFTIHKNVTHILEGAFAYNRNLQKLTMGNKVSVIEMRAFDGAKKLSSVKCSSGLKKLERYAFSNCKKIKKIVLPKKVKTVGVYAFSGCTALREAVIGQSVSRVDSWAFKDCKKLRKLTFKGKKWSKGKGIAAKAFVRAGSSSYSKLKVQVPNGNKKQRTACKKALRKGSLNKKAKIVFAK